MEVDGVDCAQEISHAPAMELAHEKLPTIGVTLVKVGRLPSLLLAKVHVA